MLYFNDISKIDHACRGSKRVLSRFKQNESNVNTTKKIGPTMPWKNFSRDRHPSPNSNPKRKVTEYLKNICGEKATCTCFPSVSCTSCPIWSAPPGLAFRWVRTKQPCELPYVPMHIGLTKGDLPLGPHKGYHIDVYGHPSYCMDKIMANVEPIRRSLIEVILNSHPNRFSVRPQRSDPNTSKCRRVGFKTSKIGYFCVARGTWFVPHVIYFDSDMRFSSCFD